MKEENWQYYSWDFESLKSLSYAIVLWKLNTTTEKDNTQCHI